MLKTSHVNHHNLIIHRGVYTYQIRGNRDQARDTRKQYIPNRIRLGRKIYALKQFIKPTEPLVVFNFLAATTMKRERVNPYTRAYTPSRASRARVSRRENQTFFPRFVRISTPPFNPRHHLTPSREPYYTVARPLSLLFSHFLKKKKRKITLQPKDGEKATRGSCRLMGNLRNREDLVGKSSRAIEYMYADTCACSKRAGKGRRVVRISTVGHVGRASRRTAKNGDHVLLARNICVYTGTRV